MSAPPYHTPDERHHQLSIASQASDADARSSEQPPLSMESQMGHTQHTQATQAGDEDDEEEADDDGPVGPWELSQSFRANGKRRRSEDDYGDEEGEEEESPTTGASEGSGSKQGDVTPKVAGVVEAEEGGKNEVVLEEGDREDHMDVDTAEKRNRGDGEEAELG